MCRNLFALQQTLTSTITGSREMALDNAKQFYELCNQVLRQFAHDIFLMHLLCWAFRNLQTSLVELLRKARCSPKQNTNLF